MPSVDAKLSWMAYRVASGSGTFMTTPSKAALRAELEAVVAELSRAGETMPGGIAARRHFRGGVRTPR
jgi:hypothetical protein